MQDAHEFDLRMHPERTLAFVVYGLYVLSVFGGVSFVIALMINFVKQKSVEDELAQNHFGWQIGCALRMLFGAVVVIAFSLLFLAFMHSTVLIIGMGLLMFVNYLWFLYSIIKGGVYLFEGRLVK